MDLVFERVYSYQIKQVNAIFEILKNSGNYMFQEQGLKHWRKEYPISCVKDNCDTKFVFIVSDANTGIYAHTFQIDLKNSSFPDQKQLLSSDHKEIVATIEKFATSPEFSGKGIGTISMDYILNFCKKNGVNKIQLDVYTESEQAIDFYMKRGFRIVGKKATRRFEVFILEKNI